MIRYTVTILIMRIGRSSIQLHRIQGHPSLFVLSTSMPSRSRGNMFLAHRQLALYSISLPIRPLTFSMDETTSALAGFGSPLRQMFDIRLYTSPHHHETSDIWASTGPRNRSFQLFASVHFAQTYQICHCDACLLPHLCAGAELEGT